MSQSPIQRTGDNPEQAYLDAWQQLATRIQQGGSFSGRERNCCFLNTHQAQFADISAASGLDLLDDARAVALVDWDQDGDLDLWQANRTGPRVRFLRNDVPTQNGFVSVRLEGDPVQGTNRDAIGARITVELEDPATGGSVRRTRTLAAGDAFLSQSSKWVHFGIAVDQTLRSIAVRWPGKTDAEVFQGELLQPNQRFHLRQGSGQPRLVESPTRKVDLVASQPAVPPVTDHARLRLSLPQLIRSIDYRDYSGKPVELPAPFDGPVLVTLWASWCQPCLHELRELTEQVESWQSRKLTIIALNVEGLAGNTPPSPQQLQALLERAGWSADSPQFISGMASDGFVEQLDQVHRNAIYRDRALPLPSSFLIDFGGWLNVMYKGPLTPTQLAADIDKLRVSETEGLRLSVPFAGRWGAEYLRADPIAVTQVQLTEGYPADALSYLDAFLGDNPLPPESRRDREAEMARLRIADVQYQRGLALSALGQHPEAIAAFREAVRINRRLVPAMIGWAESLLHEKDFAKSQVILQNARNLAPNDANVVLALARWHREQGQLAEATTLYKSAMQLNLGLLSAARELAWLLATADDRSVRNGAQALRLAQAVCEREGYSHAESLDVLAAAHAEQGDLASAVRWTQRALQLLAEDDPSAIAIRERLKRYRTPTQEDTSGP